MKTATPSTCQPGAIVRFTDKFCRAIGNHSPPLNGIVIRVSEGRRQTAIVWWSDEEPGIGRVVLLENLELCPHNSRTADSMRETLLAEFHENAQNPEFSKRQNSELRAIRDALSGSCLIESFGTVYHANGSAIGSTGSIGGLSPENVRQHCMRLLEKHQAGHCPDWLKITDDSGTVLCVGIHDSRNLHADRFEIVARPEN
jgi:hypothetical protein